ncbi:MAG: dTDP-4-amino-4,6-dideoxygalactose transaminase [Candidatus Alcyoniella australis]|nr:dTDP-4-amino-4,6-dideoxygalactose transaminase [Candidatus Alcyoniella australis]
MPKRQIEKVPFNRPHLTGNELQYVSRAIESGWISGDGEYTRRCNELLAKLTGAPKVLLTTSCTHALELSALLLDLKPGDEVIVPSFTFVSTVNPFVLRGAKPVWIDIRPDTLNLDECLIEGLISKRTRALVAVNYAGVACKYDQIREICDRHNIALIEDNAHGLFASYRGRPLGTFGELATLSFHETKNVTCGEGGALIINDPRHIERAEIIREKGTNRSRFFRGEVDKYTWVDLGSSYLPSEINAAFLFAQLEARERIQAGRRAIWERYHDELMDWAQDCEVWLPHVSPEYEQPYHMFQLLMPTNQSRDRLLAYLREREIYAVFHYLPLHQSKMGNKLGARAEECPVTVDVSSRLVRLPFYNGMSQQDQQRVIQELCAFVP